MALQTFTLTSYTDNTWTDLVATAADVETLIVDNTNASTAVTVNVRVGSAEIAGAKVIPAGESRLLQIGVLAVTASQKLQVKASASGIHFVAVGDV